jgi:hypothetical protein
MTNAQEATANIATARMAYVVHAIDLLAVWIESSQVLRKQRESNQSPLETIMIDLYNSLLDLKVDYADLPLDDSMAERIASGMAQAVLALKVTATTEAHYSNRPLEA